MSVKKYSPNGLPFLQAQILEQIYLDICQEKETQIKLFFEARDISKLNRYGVIHKLYNFLEEFPYSLIEEKIIEYKLKHDSLVADPFCGSGTTLVPANMFRINAIGFGTNPLMIFISKVKTTWDIDIDKFKKQIRIVGNEFLQRVNQILPIL